MNFSEPVEFSILSRWEAKGLAKSIWNGDVQEHWINARRKKYVFPDYLDLVGSPKIEHYAADGELTLERKARLLLIGVFRWRGLLITNYDNCWMVVNDSAFNPTRALKLYDDRKHRPWEKDKRGWYAPSGRGAYKSRLEVDPGDRPGVSPSKALELYKSIAWERGYFDPFNGYRSSPLVEHLYGDQERNSQYLIQINENPYNCSPDNIVIICTRKKTAALRKAINLSDPMAYNILRVLHDHPKGMTRHEILNYFRRNKSGLSIGRALDVLAHERLAFSNRERTRGRPAERWTASCYKPVQPATFCGA